MLKNKKDMVVIQVLLQPKVKKRKKRSDVTGSLVVQNYERVESCSFCQGKHRITTCMKKIQREKNGME